jgi:nicotinamide-nucleotide amidase
MSEQIIPKVKKQFTLPAIVNHYILTQGTYEAHLSELLESFEKKLPKHITLAYLPSLGLIKLRLTAKGSDKEILKKQLAEQVDAIIQHVKPYVLAQGNVKLEELIGELLNEKGKTVSTAESCTGGTIASLITSVSGSSTYFKGSVVAYANEVKTELLGVDSRDIEKYGVVSQQVVSQMAEGARKQFKTDYAVATSGIAGPTGGTAEKPVGTVWIAVADEKGVQAEKSVLGVRRDGNILRSSLIALNMLRMKIKGNQ